MPYYIEVIQWVDFLYVLGAVEDLQEDSDVADADVAVLVALVGQAF